MLDARPHIGFCLISSIILPTAKFGKPADGNAFFKSLVACVKLFPAMKVCIVPDY